MIRRLVAALVLALALAAPASAEQVAVTAQAKAANAEFLLRVSPPGPAAAICMVDTGVNANPDTTAVVDRRSLPGLDGSDTSPSLHGTQVAMFMAAASNGYGMVGLWPGARIVSVQANYPGQDAFTPATYVNGIDECDRFATRFGIKVILLALSSEIALTDEERDALHDVVLMARNHGSNIVVAAGNHDGRPPGVPASTPGAFSIGASNSGSGELCPSSATGARLLAPGCAIDGADPITGQPTTSQQGTSMAAAVAAAALAALRSWRPDLSPDAAEQLLLDSAVPTAAGPRLDVAAAFDAAGLKDLTALPATSEATSQSPPTATPTTTPPGPTVAKKARLVTPRVTIRVRQHRLTVQGLNRPVGTSMTVQIYARAKTGKLRRVALQTRRSRTVRIDGIQRWSRVTVRYTDPTGTRLPSQAAIVLKR